MAFIKYMSKAHLNGMNVGLYDNENGATLRAENVINNHALGIRQFPSIDAAQNWFASLPGNQMGRLANALDELKLTHIGGAHTPPNQ